MEASQDKSGASRRAMYITVGAVVLLGAAAIAVTLANRPSAALDLEKQGIMWAQNGNFEKALEFLHKAAQEDPQNARVQYNIGEAYLGLEQYSPAADHLYKAVVLEPANSGFRAEYARTLCILKHPDECFEALFQAVEAGFCDWQRIADSHDFDIIRFDERYLKLRRAMRAKCPTN